ncbi:BTAD domain-containing putative transcriptional regulator [Streptomyces sp. NPDC058086]|uniref:AfsR/SARP family transcriptional regulator n=1 Tax=Streptomyces sp. NPDC058086 TaxID=3346334 RepID=UPI0036E6A0B2
MRFTVLGPVRAWVNGREAPLGPPQQRAVLTALLLQRGRPVGVAELVDALWGEEQPSDPVAIVRTYVSRLRRVLEPDRVPGSPPQLVVSIADGYALCIDDSSLDLAVFEARLAEARGLLREGDPARASELLRSALVEWGGTPLSGVPGPLAETERSRLVELRLGAIEVRLSVDLVLGRHEDLVGELTSLRARHPLRERLSELLLLALYRCGRQAEALEMYRLTRRMLVEELGVDPGPALRELHSRVLTADPSLSLPGVVVAGGGGDGVDAVDRDAACFGWVPDRETGVDSDVPSFDEVARHREGTGEDAITVQPSQLPAVLNVFTGRMAELAHGEALLSDKRRPAVVAISGMAGTGKTAFAVHWAHRIASCFPDGQLFVSLRGVDSGSTADPEAVIRHFLEALGMSSHEIPADPLAQAALYRSLLAERRMLIVLDDAQNSEQVRPLLPGTSSCFVIVTSRTRLQGLVVSNGARPLWLDLMSPDEARDMLTRRIGAARVAAEPQALDAIVELCGRLPLALAVVAARAAMHPCFPLSAIAEELTESQGSLDAFADGDPATDARAAFSWSYRALSPGAARLFRLLSLHLGPEISVPTAASLAAVPPRDARAFLADLARVHLLAEVAPGRFDFHDLLRCYAAELVREHDTEAERHRAEQRLLDHFLHTALGASTLLTPYRETVEPPEPLYGTTPEQITDLQGAMGWLQTERRMLCTTVVQASTGAFAGHAWRLASAMVPFLDRQGYWHDLLLTQQAALTAARRVSDGTGQAHAHQMLGFTFVRLQRTQEARPHLERALELFTFLGDPLGQARTHRILALQDLRAGGYEAACGRYQLAYALYERAGHLSGQASVLNELGWIHIMLGWFKQAVDYCARAITLHQKSGDLMGEAAAHDGLGYAHHCAGDYAAAINCYQRALVPGRRIGDRCLEASALGHMGEAQRALGNTEAARAAWQAAVSILETLGHPDARKVRDSLRLLDQS